MINTHRGFILLIVLLFLQLFSILSLIGLMQAQSILKLQDHQWEMQKNKLWLQTLLKKIENKNLSLCMIKNITANRLTEKRMSWWKAKPCYGETQTFHYYYVVETLAIDACGLIDETHVAQYYRITILLLSDTLHAAKYYIQSIIVKPVLRTLNCAEDTRAVHLGRQMWREI